MYRYTRSVFVINNIIFRFTLHIRSRHLLVRWTIFAFDIYFILLDEVLKTHSSGINMLLIILTCSTRVYNDGNNYSYVVVVVVPYGRL